MSAHLQLSQKKVILLVNRIIFQGRYIALGKKGKVLSYFQKITSNFFFPIPFTPNLPFSLFWEETLQFLKKAVQLIKKKLSWKNSANTHWAKFSNSMKV